MSTMSPLFTLVCRFPGCQIDHAKSALFYHPRLMDVSISLEIGNKTLLFDTDNPKLDFQLRSKVFLMLCPKTL